ncbi:phosphoribosyltransferase family protein [Nonomuraea sp. NPDC049152]|uniref:ComF family protein n=1 Tax=Nonomuraea sp. NPDC049152 TaxID=3154350 RepID=UPI003404A7A4
MLDLLLPTRCVGCATRGGLLCDACLVVTPAVRMPHPAPEGLPICWSATLYEGAARQAVLHYKERGRTALATPLAHALALTIATAVPVGGLAVVPVPSARRAVRARGHDPVGRMAALAVRHLVKLGRQVTLRADLRQSRRVADQAGLSAARRAANLASSLRVVQVGKAGLSGRSGPPVVLVDDVVTTGATLAEAARAVDEAGAKVVAAVTFAATRRRVRTAFDHGG